MSNFFIPRVLFFVFEIRLDNSEKCQLFVPNTVTLSWTTAVDKNTDKFGERKYRGQIMNGEEVNNPVVSQSSATTNGTSAVPKTNFVLGEYQRRKSKVLEQLLI